MAQNNRYNIVILEKLLSLPSVNIATVVCKCLPMFFYVCGTPKVRAIFIIIKESNMDNFKFDEAERASWIERFLDSFKRLLNLADNRGDKQINDVLAEIGESDEEKALIREQCEEIDSFHESIKKLQSAKKEDPELTEGEWLCNEIEADVQELVQKNENRNLTDEELKALRNSIVEALDKEIVAEAEGLNDDLELLDGALTEQKNKEE